MEHFVAIACIWVGFYITYITNVPIQLIYYSILMILANLANEYKENGMVFEELEVSGDVPLPLYGQGVVMDGKYIYSIGGTSGYEYEMDVHRFDLSTKKWELLHKSLGEGQEPEPRYRHEVVCYKDRIYIFGGGRGGTRNIYYGFSVSVKYFIYFFKFGIILFNRFILWTLVFNSLMNAFLFCNLLIQ